MKKIITLAIVFFALCLPTLAEDSYFLPGEEREPYRPQQTTIKRQFDYPAFLVVTFVDRCATSMMGYMPMHPTQSRPIALQMCSCIMDQFRSDFDMDAFTKGGVKLAQAMGKQYSEVCKQLEFGNKTQM